MNNLPRKKETFDLWTFFDGLFHEMVVPREDLSLNRQE